MPIHSFSNILQKPNSYLNQLDDWLPAAFIGSGIGIAHGSTFEKGLLSKSYLRPYFFAASWLFIVSGLGLRASLDGYQNYHNVQKHIKKEGDAYKDFSSGLGLTVVTGGLSTFFANVVLGVICMPFKLEGSNLTTVTLLLGSAFLGGALDFYYRNRLDLSV